jgi:mannose-6-phosphate isomerase-like protein (cupin superfamily)
MRRELSRAQGKRRAAARRKLIPHVAQKLEDAALRTDCQALLQDKREATTQSSNKLCKLQNDFVWHSHEDEDELFMVFKGTLLMDFRDGRTIEVNEGEILIVPKGVEHRPHTNGEIVFSIGNPWQRIM